MKYDSLENKLAGGDGYHSAYIYSRKRNRVIVFIMTFSRQTPALQCIVARRKVTQWIAI